MAGARIRAISAVGGLRYEPAGMTHGSRQPGRSPCWGPRPAKNARIFHVRKTQSQCLQHLQMDLQSQWRKSLLSEWSVQDFKRGEMVFSCTHITTSEGEKRENTRDRYLEIQSFPTADSPGRGKYFKMGRVESVFTLTDPWQDGTFLGEQRNGRPFILNPIIQDDKPTGFVWTMPDEYPLFVAKFALSEAARKDLAEERISRRENSAYGRFLKKVNRRSTHTLW